MRRSECGLNVLVATCVGVELPVGFLSVRDILRMGFVYPAKAAFFALLSAWIRANSWHLWSRF